MRFNKFKSFFKLELKALFREPVTLFFMIVLPIILTVVFGGAFGQEMTQYGENVLGIDTVVPVNIVFLIANVGLMGVPITIIELKDQEVLKRYSTYIGNYSVYFLSLITVFFVVSIFSTFLFGAISFIIYGAKWYMSPVETALFIFIYCVCVFIFDAVGFLIALIIKGSRTANMIVSGIFLSLIFMSGVVLPVDSLPGIVQKLTTVFPMYHSIEVIQMLWISEFSFFDMKLHLLYLGIVSLILFIALKSVKIRWD